MKLLTKNVYYDKYDDLRDKPSIGLVKGKDHSLLIDAGSSKEHIEDVTEKVNSLKINNLKYLGITHWHWDHIYGINSLNLDSIGSKKTKDKISRVKTLIESKRTPLVDEESTIKGLKSLYKENNKVGNIDIAFDSKIEIDLGDNTVIFQLLGGDHAEDSSLIYIAEDKVMFLGDGTYRGFWNGKRYNSLENLERIEKIIFSYDCNTFITSHKEIYTRRELSKELNTLIYIGKVIGDKLKIEDIKGNFSEEEKVYVQSFLEWNNIKTLNEKKK